MCEFTVYLENKSAGRKEVAKNIVAARRSEGKILLMDAFGLTTAIEDALIDEANTFTQEMILKTA